MPKAKLFRTITETQRPVNRRRGFMRSSFQEKRLFDGGVYSLSRPRLEPAGPGNALPPATMA